MRIQVGGNNSILASRYSGAQLRTCIVGAFGADKVELDFSEVEILSESFADELFGVLVEQYDLVELFDRISIRGARPGVVRSIAKAIRYRLELNGRWEHDALEALVARRSNTTRSSQPA